MTNVCQRLLQTMSYMHFNAMCLWTLAAWTSKRAKRNCQPRAAALSFAMMACCTNMCDHLFALSVGAI